MNEEQEKVLRNAFNETYENHTRLLNKRDELNDSLLQVQQAIDTSVNLLDSLRVGFSFPVEGEQ